MPTKATPAGRTQIFSKARGVFEWKRASRITPALLAGGVPGPSPRERVKACLWLEDTLRPGEDILASAVYDLAEKQDLDYSKRTLRMAAEALGVQNQRERRLRLETSPLSSLQEEEVVVAEAGEGSVSSVPSVRSVRSVSCDENIDVTGIPHGTKKNMDSERPPDDPDDPDDPDHTDHTDLIDFTGAPSDQGIRSPCHQNNLLIPQRTTRRKGSSYDRTRRDVLPRTLTGAAHSPPSWSCATGLRVG